MVVANVDDEAHALALAKRVFGRVTGPSMIAGVDVEISVSMGVAVTTQSFEGGRDHRATDGLAVEFTCDAADVEHINAIRRADAGAEMRRWLDGDRTPNNTLRWLGGATGRRGDGLRR